MAKVEHSETWVCIWGSEKPAYSIGYDEPSWPNDTGFTVLFDDAPHPEDVPEDGQHPLIAAMHTCCLLEEYPEIIPGLKLAREHGAADLDDDGEWVGRTLSPGLAAAPGVEPR